MTMKRVALAVVAVALVFTLTSCEELFNQFFGEKGITIEERIAAFETTLNDPERTPEALRSHLHPLMDDYAAVAAEQYWLTGPLIIDYSEFIIGEPDIVDNVATCTYEDGNGVTGTIVFTMELDGADYKIRVLELTLTGETDPSFDIRLLETS